MPEPFALVVSLWVSESRRAAFEEYERQAASVMAAYGGTIERVVRVHAGHDDEPDEVHVVTFPDVASYERYRADPRLQALAPVRAAVIARTHVVSGYVASGYSGPTLQA